MDKKGATHPVASRPGTTCYSHVMGNQENKNRHMFSVTVNNITKRKTSPQEIYEILAKHGIWAPIIDGEYFPLPENIKLEEKAGRTGRDMKKPITNMRTTGGKADTASHIFPYWSKLVNRKKR